MIEPAKVNYVPPVVDNPVEAGDHATDAPDWRLVKAELAEQ
jgi:hypothetical protein